MLKVVFGEQTVSWTWVLEWFIQFSSSFKCVDDVQIRPN